MTGDSPLGKSIEPNGRPYTVETWDADRDPKPELPGPSIYRMEPGPSTYRMKPLLLPLPAHAPVVPNASLRYQKALRKYYAAFRLVRQYRPVNDQRENQADGIKGPSRAQRAKYSKYKYAGQTLGRWRGRERPP